MKEIILPDVEILQFEKDGKLFYGGTQQHYKSFWARRSGCGPTTASNLLVYLSRTHPKMRTVFPYRVINYKSMLEMMNTMWNFVTPSHMGVNKISSLLNGMEEYLNQLGVDIFPSYLEIPTAANRPSLQEVSRYLADRLQHNFPVAFLNLHAGDVSNLDKWHWVLIVGIKYEEDKLIATIYDEGDKKDIDLALWLKTTKREGGFVSLKCS